MSHQFGRELETTRSLALLTSTSPLDLRVHQAWQAGILGFLRTYPVGHPSNRGESEIACGV